LKLVLQAGASDPQPSRPRGSEEPAALFSKGTVRNTSTRSNMILRHCYYHIVFWQTVLTTVDRARPLARPFGLAFLAQAIVQTSFTP